MTTERRVPIEERLTAAYAARLTGIDDDALGPVPSLEPVGQSSLAAPPNERRSHRAGHRAVLVAAACVVTAAIVSTAVALTSGRPHSTQPVGPTATASIAPTQTPTQSTSATTSPAPSTPHPVTGGAHWDSTTLVLGAHSLGGVEIGMTSAAAAHAAGVSAFSPVGDGVLVADGRAASANPDLYLGNFAGQPASTIGGSFSCVGAALIGSQAPTQTVTTAQGLRLGDPAARVRAIYGSTAAFLPLPSTGGIDPHAGYVVHQGNYDLVFKLDANNTHVVAIAGGLAPMTPSECNS